MGVDPARVLKTLLATVDGALTVAVVPVTGKLDLKALARAVGGSKAAMADPADAERATGYVVGGISPIGQRRRHPTVIDATALDHDTVLVSGGRRARPRAGTGRPGAGDGGRHGTGRPSVLTGSDDVSRRS